MFRFVIKQRVRSSVLQIFVVRRLRLFSGFFQPRLGCWLRTGLRLGRLQQGECLVQSQRGKCREGWISADGFNFVEQGLTSVTLTLLGDISRRRAPTCNLTRRSRHELLHGFTILVETLLKSVWLCK